MSGVRTLPDSIPLIDLSSEKSAVVEAIGEACRTFGFFTVVGHGVLENIDQRAWDNARAFFDLTNEQKQEVVMPEAGYPYGYAPFAFERLASSMGDVTPPDLKETYTVGPVDDAPRPAVDPDEAWARSPTLWPSALPEAKPAFEDYYRAMSNLAERLLQLCALALDLPEHYFDQLIDAHISALRFLNYPELKTAPLPGQLRAGAHTDYGTITILRQEHKLGGLQVLSPLASATASTLRNEDWIDVPYVPGSYVVNLGDAMARWTNDRWRSTLHRVVTPSCWRAPSPLRFESHQNALSNRQAGLGTPPVDVNEPTRRQSVAFFHNANWETVIECLPSCQSSDEPPRYAPISAGPHLMSKFQSTQY
jgi:isopenicillin N synthase-like dioxygenase